MAKCRTCGAEAPRACDECGRAICGEHTSFYRWRPLCDNCWEDLVRVGIIAWLPVNGAAREERQPERVAAPV